MQSLIFLVGPLITLPTGPAELDPGQYGLELSDGLALQRVILGDRGEHFGDKLFVLPDVDGDGIPDIAISARPWVGGLSTGIGHVSIHSGRTFEERFRVVGEEHPDPVFGDGIATDPLGQSLAVGPDENDDGVADLHLLGGDALFGSGYLRVVSGSDGALIRQEASTAKHLPIESRRIGDVVVRCLAGSRGRKPGSTSTSSSRGALYLSIDGSDIDLDGHNDRIQVRYLEGARTNRSPASQKAMDLSVADGRSGELKWEHRVHTPKMGRVAFVGEVGDLNADGVNDLGIGAIDGDRGTLTLRSGKDGSALASASGSTRWSFGSSCVSLGDVYGDGSTILAVGEYENRIAGGCAGAVFVFALRLPPD